MHWHGVALRNDMDGTLVTQQPVQPGVAFTYQFRIDEPGTYWYHRTSAPSRTGACTGC